MRKIKTNTAPSIFQTQFGKIQHQRSTRFSKSIVENQLVLSQAKFFVSS